MQVPIIKDRMESLAHSIQRKHLQVGCLLPRAAVANPAENRVVGENRCRGPDGAAEAEVFLGGVIPRAAVHWLPQPGSVIRQRFESPTTPAVIGGPWIPEPVIGGRGTPIHACPRA